MEDTRSKKQKRFDARVSAALRRRTHRAPRCYSRIFKSYLAKDERENCKMLFEKFGVKYWVEKKRLRVIHKIPWGVDFDVRDPAACPQAGRWNGALELFAEVWKNSTPEEKREFVAQVLPPSPLRN